MVRLNNKINMNSTLDGFMKHILLSLMILIIPFSGTEYLGNNLLGISGAKPLNIIALLVFASWLLKGGEIITFRNKITANAFVFFILYLLMFTVAFYRAYDNIDILIIRNSKEFGAILPSKSGFLLSFYIRPILTTISFFYIINHIKNNNDADSLVNIIVYSICLFAAFTLLISIDLVLNGQPRSDLKISFQDTFGFHYNTVGTILMLGVPLAFARIITLGRQWYIIFGVILLALLFSQSRGSILGSVIGMLTFLFLQRKINTSMIVAIFVLGLFGYLLSDFIVPLFSKGLESGDLSEISSGRIDTIWMPLLSELASDLSKLLFGLGLYGIVMSDAFVNNFNFFQASHAHNAFIDLLVDAGLIVFGLFSILMLYLTKKAIKYSRILKNPTYNGLVASVAAYLIAALTGRHLFPRIDNIMLFPIIALIIIFITIYKNKQKRIAMDWYRGNGKV